MLQSKHEWCIRIRAVRSFYCVLSHRLKNASQPRQEAAQLEVENVEDDLMQKTEVTTMLMKTVLENVHTWCCPSFIADVLTQ